VHGLPAPPPRSNKTAPKKKCAVPSTLNRPCNRVGVLRTSPPPPEKKKETFSPPRQPPPRSRPPQRRRMELSCRSRESGGDVLIDGGGAGPERPARLLEACVLANLNPCTTDIERPCGVVAGLRWVSDTRECSGGQYGSTA